MRYLSKTQPSYFRPMLLGGLFLLIVAALMGTAYTAEADLPPRPEPSVPTSSTRLQGGQIQLIASHATDGMWTEIQWHDVQNDIWYTVDGWKGHVTIEADGTTGTQTWWVARKQFDTGPYRWVVFDSEDGEQIAVTDSFDTPVSDETVTIVEIDLSE